MPRFPIIAAIAALTPSAFGSGPRSCEELYANVEKVIENKFSFGVDARLIGHLTVPKRAVNGVRLRLVSRLWQDVRPDDAFTDLVSETARTGQIGSELGRRSGWLRAKLKVMRFICQAVCEEGGDEADRMNTLTVVLGHLDDAKKFGTPEQVKKGASEVAALLRSGIATDIDRETERLQPIGSSALAKKIAEMVSFMRETVGQPEISEKDFHEVRKDLGRLQTIVLLNGAENGDISAESSYQHMRALYDAIGDEHDKMVKAELAGSGDKPVSYSPELRKRVEEVLGYF